MNLIKLQYQGTEVSFFSKRCMRPAVFQKFGQSKFKCHEEHWLLQESFYSNTINITATTRATSGLRLVGNLVEGPWIQRDTSLFHSLCAHTK